MVWKSPTLGGVPYGQERMENADKILWDIGLSRYGEKGKGKMATQFLPGRIIDTIIGTRGLDEPEDSMKDYPVDGSWRDNSYDRIGIVIRDFTFELDQSKLKNPFLRLVKFVVGDTFLPNGISNGTSGDDVRNSVFHSQNRIYVESKEDIFYTDTPCIDVFGVLRNIEENHELVSCGVNQFITLVTQKTGNALPDGEALELFYDELVKQGKMTEFERDDLLHWWTESDDWNVLLMGYPWCQGNMFRIPLPKSVA